MFIGKTREIKQKPFPLIILFKCDKLSWGGVWGGVKERDGLGAFPILNHISRYQIENCKL
jgi:hypothetical protein